MQWNARSLIIIQMTLSNLLLVQKRNLRPGEGRVGKAGFQALSPRPLAVLTGETWRGGL